MTDLEKFKEHMRGVSYLVLGWDEPKFDDDIHFSAIPIADIDEEMLMALLGKNSKSYKRLSKNFIIRHEYEIEELRCTANELDKLNEENRGYGAEKYLFGEVKTYKKHVIDGYMEINGTKHFVQVKCSTNKGGGTSSTNNLFWNLKEYYNIVRY